MKQFIGILLLLHFISPSLYAQMDKWGWEKIDSAYIICQYQYRHLSSINRDKTLDDMRLEIGRKSSKFYSYLTSSYDSLASTREGELLIREMKMDIMNKYNQCKDKEEAKNIFYQAPHRHSSFTVYTNYSERKIVVQDRLGDIDYIYEEEIMPQAWIIHEDTTSIIGYLCQKAICSWRGRDYIAWFTPEIPISLGPMKFHGLPGLIMKIEDTRQEYSFEIEGIQQVIDKPIYLNKPLNNKDFQRTTRMIFAKRSARLLTNMIRNTNKELSKIGIFSNNNDMATDLMELDYK